MFSLVPTGIRVISSGVGFGIPSHESAMLGGGSAREGFGCGWGAQIHLLSGYALSFNLITDHIFRSPGVGSRARTQRRLS